ncbi:MAG: hypothetical protein KC445_08105 [Anaerolineales bacterium]|nr:hypothetical protein [Anaerolineales bacterium]
MKVKLLPFLTLVFTAVFTAQLFLLSTPAPVTALPPRPTPTAVPAPPLPGAQIRLQLAGEMSANNWTIVQWQDAAGSWHDVSGWQGELEADGSKTWWVGQELLGSGPFRWLVLLDGTAVAHSDVFELPTQPGTTLPILIELE